MLMQDLGKKMTSDVIKRKYRLARGVASTHGKTISDGLG